VSKVAIAMIVLPKKSYKKYETDRGQQTDLGFLGASS
jgi:hypothetical protein